MESIYLCRVKQSDNNLVTSLKGSSIRCSTMPANAWTSSGPLAKGIRATPGRKSQKKTGINPNGDFTTLLKALIASDFLKKYVPYGESKREEYYKLSDCFCWFWLHFKESGHITETDYWCHHLKEPEIASWRGIAFEEVCFQHIPQIKAAMQIAGVSTVESALIVKGKHSDVFVSKITLDELFR